MSARAWTAVVLVLAIVGAGCVEEPGITKGTVSGSSSAAPVATASEPAAAPSVSAETGALSITVTTSELQPVEAAQVELDGRELRAFTDAAGVVTFNDLEPGKYTVLVAKPGYKSNLEKGKLVDVVAGEVTEVKMVLEPEVVVSVDNKYSRITTIDGFISCAFWITFVGYNNNCGRGVTTTGGTQVTNPNDKTVHPWTIENAQVQTLVLELTWAPSQAALGSELWGRIMATFGCGGTTGQLCAPEDDIENKGGKSPLLVREDEGLTGNITRKTEKYAKGVYPYKAYVEVRPWCIEFTSGVSSGATPGSRGSCTHNIMINQRYEGFATAFYGEAAPLGYSAYPK